MNISTHERRLIRESVLKLENSPLLNKTKFLKVFNTQGVIDYIGYVYHPESPFRNDASILKTKLAAAEAAKFKKTQNGNYNSFYEGIMSGADELFNFIVFEYLKSFHDLEYMEFKIHQSKFEELLVALMNIQLTDKDSQENLKRCRENIIAEREQIKALRDIILRGEDNKSIINDFYKQMDYERTGLYPEEIASVILDGEDPLGGFIPDFL